MLSPRATLAPYPSHPVYTALESAALRIPNKVAIIDGERRFTFLDLNTAVDRFASALLAIGIAKGDRVALLSPNSLEFEIAFFGILKAGAVATTINAGYREGEIAHQINSSGANVLIVDQSLTEIASAAREITKELNKTIVIKNDSDDPESFWGLIQTSPDLPVRIQINPKEDLAVLPYSSGTTGLTKGVMLTHHNLTSNIRQMGNRVGEDSVIKQGDVVLVHLPLFHIYGMVPIMSCSIAAGATQVVMGRFDMDRFLSLIATHRVSMLYTVPPVALGLTLSPDVKSYDLSSLRLGTVGAAPMSGEMQQRLADGLGFTVVQAYGLTETSPVTNTDFSEPSTIRPGSVGPALPDTEEKVMDLETGTKELKFGEIGELVIRGPQVMKGYYNESGATADVLTDDGWFHTGDIVRMDPDGYVWILDRKKELIKYKGFQVPPAELEGILLEHPAIADAAVIPKPDIEAGEVPKAFVVTKKGNSISESDLMKFVAAKVATFKQIREVEFVDSIPKNPSGKLLRRALVERDRERNTIPGETLSQ